MKIGIPKESKDREYRVGMVPDGASALVRAGHEVMVERGAGFGSGFRDEDYVGAGARIVERDEAWSSPDLVVKVKEPVGDEPGMLHPGQTLFTYLHLAAAPELAHSLLDAEVCGIAYETVQDTRGRFPLLAPMSEVAGRLAPQIGAQLLLKDQGGKGLLLGGVPGVMRGRVTILGAGIVGTNALRIAHALGAQVDLIDIDLARLAEIEEQYRGTVNTLSSNPGNIERSVLGSDLLIGAVYLRGRLAPRLVSEDLVRSMQAGSVVVDVAVDQGGCIETIHATTHSNPTYMVGDIVHYGVANMPGAVPRTSTLALTNATLPYVVRLANEGVQAAVQDDRGLASGVSVWRGNVVCEGVAETLDVPAVKLSLIP
ncbi:MAG: alanine dehydrogenase [Myxococcota bacterium]|jgi:alanine dehydrogenase|nr:alanine dehydrogenase [Myxococcota bacterium]